MILFLTIDVSDKVNVDILHIMPQMPTRPNLYCLGIIVELYCGNVLKFVLTGIRESHRYSAA